MYEDKETREKEKDRKAKECIEVIHAFVAWQGRGKSIKRRQLGNDAAEW